MHYKNTSTLQIKDRDLIIRLDEMQDFYNLKSRKELIWFLVNNHEEFKHSLTQRDIFIDTMNNEINSLKSVILKAIDCVENEKVKSELQEIIQ